ncbi:MAG: hypothetical protein ACLU99_03585 [Alphaproteobacteria bacterium]
MRFAVECLKDIGTYQEETNNDNLILRNCCAVTEDKPENEPNLSERLSDIFEHIYNQEIVVTKPVFRGLAGERPPFRLPWRKKRLIN